MLKQKYKISAAVVCLLFFLLAFFSATGFGWGNLKYSGNGILADEIPHISGGYYYLKTNRYFINPEHPPLVKDIAGLGEMLYRPAFPNITDQESLPPDFHRAEFPFQNTNFPKALEWANNQDHFGVLYLFHPQNNPDAIAFFARLAVILANSLLLYLLFVFVSRLWSERSALLGLFFVAISPFSIAHASFVTIDFMSGLLCVIALVVFASYLKNRWQGEKTNVYFLLAAVFFALALLSKFSSVVIIPAAFLGGFAFVAFAEFKDREGLGGRLKAISKYLISFVAVMLGAVFLISMFYAFHVYKSEDSTLAQKIHESYPEEQLPKWGHQVVDVMVYGNVLTKGLAEYANGVFMVVSRMVVSAQNTYFLGHVYGNEGAGGWYFPVLYFTKLPLGMHLFSITAIFLLAGSLFREKKPWKKRFAKFASNPLALLLFTFGYLYMLVTFSSTFQIGLRHIMPVIVSASVLTGRGVDLFWEKKMFGYLRLQHMFLAVAAVMVVVVFAVFPYYLSYFNSLAGGTDKGYFIATDSNYDWGGSDVRRLAKWTRDNNVHDIYTQIFADVPLRYYLGDGQKFFNLQDSGKLPPSGSYVAVSVFEYMNNVYSDWIPPERKYTILQNNLVARVGKTIFLYRVP